MLNKAVIQGRFASDPELKETGTGKYVCNFTLAVSENYKQKDGTVKAAWIDCAAWGKTAETICKFFSKGDAIIVDGRIDTRSYNDSTNVKRKITEIVIEGFNFVGNKTNGSGNTDNGSIDYDKEFGGVATYASLDENGGLPF